MGHAISSEQIALRQSGQVQGAVVELFAGLVPGQDRSCAERIRHAGRAHAGYFHHLPLSRFAFPVMRITDVGPGVPGGSDVGDGSDVGHRLPEQWNPTALETDRAVAAVVVALVQQVDTERLVGMRCIVKVVQAAVEQRKLRGRWQLWKIQRWLLLLRGGGGRYRNSGNALTVGKGSTVRQMWWPRSLWVGRQSWWRLGVSLVHRFIVSMMEVVHVMMLVIVVCLARGQRSLVQRHQSKFSRERRVVDGQRLVQVFPSADGHATTLDLLTGHQVVESSAHSLGIDPQLPLARVTVPRLAHMVPFEQLLRVINPVNGVSVDGQRVVRFVGLVLDPRIYDTRLTGMRVREYGLVVRVVEDVVPVAQGEFFQVRDFCLVDDVLRRIGVLGEHHFAQLTPVSLFVVTRRYVRSR